jgi:GNAT superfamily N-acetyltransferase
MTVGPAAGAPSTQVQRSGDEGAVGEAITVRRARIEEIRPLAVEYKQEHEAIFGEPTLPPLPQGGIFWLATEPESGEPLGYAAGTLRPAGCTIGPVFTRGTARRRGVGEALVGAIQQWATDTRVPVVEVSVAADNEGGIAFLRSLGYEQRRILMSLTPVGARPVDR